MLPELSIQRILTEYVQNTSRETSPPVTDLQVLLAHILGKPRSWILAHPEAILEPTEYAGFQEAIAQLDAGIPLPYILGHWEFFGLDFLVTPDVLIPRPETELLVETAISWIRSFCREQEDPLKTRLQIYDVGTGSGCIAVSLAVQLPEAHFTATDISAAALEIARLNAQQHGVADRIQFIQADLLDLPAIASFLPSANCHLILANLPYIATVMLNELEVYGKEPTLALDGGSDGLRLIHRLLEAAPGILASDDLILLEIEATQGDLAFCLARQHFPKAEIALLPDLAGRNRLLSIQI